MYENPSAAMQKQMVNELEEQLSGLTRVDFSEGSLFFEYDGHQNNLSEDDGKNVLDEMLLSFDNETENGKYISAIRWWKHS